MSKSSAKDRLRSEALRLPAAERAELALRLFESLEEKASDAGRADVEQAWLKEAELRYQRYLSGATQAVTSADALGRVREALREE